MSAVVEAATLLALIGIAVANITFLVKAIREAGDIRKLLNG